MNGIDEFAKFKQWLLDERLIDEPCPKCHGTGVIAYPTTATWHGGLGGNMITAAQCNYCWGSGDAVKRWPKPNTQPAAQDGARVGEQLSASNILNHKWLDPECVASGCQSLRYRQELSDQTGLKQKAYDALRTEQLRFDALWLALPFDQRHRFGGDANEARQGVDALRDAELMNVLGSVGTNWTFDPTRVTAQRLTYEGDDNPAVGSPSAGQPEVRSVPGEGDPEQEIQDGQGSGILDRAGHGEGAETRGPGSAHSDPL